MGGRNGWLEPLLITALLLVGFALKGVLITPPSPPTRAAVGDFDSVRALGRLKRILGDERAHPVDSEANDAVRERLVAELRAIGLDPQIRTEFDCSGMPKSRVVSCARVRNIVATVAGLTPGRHLLLNSHYDSTPTGPGAADDGIGVATILEVAANLRSSPPQRPVTFLFNEGEEYGLNGAAAFVRNDPLADRVNSLINIESRGVSGPAVMFETGDPNGAAIALYQVGARRPYANSLSTDFAKLIPNTTDVVKFAPRGWTLLNFAIIGNEARYHTPGDTIAALDRASLHHMGSEVLAATRVMAANDDPARIYSPRTVFTDLAGRSFIALPLFVGAILLGLLLLGAFVTAKRRQALGKPLLLVAAMGAVGIVAAVAVSIAATVLRPGDFWRAFPLVTYLGVYAVLLTAMAAIWLRWGGRFERERMRAAAWLFILIAGCLLGIAVPGAIIFFLIGPAVALAGIALRRRMPAPGRVLIASAAIIHFLMIAQQLALIEMLLIDGPLWAVAPLAALAVLPFTIEIDSAASRPAVLALTVASVGLWTAALIVPSASAERPAAFTIDYFRDDARKKAHWAIASKQAPLPEGFPGKWRKGVLEYNGRTRWIAPAPMVELPNPRARIVEIAPVGAGRRVQLALSPGGAQSVSIRFAKGTPVLALGLPGAPLPIPEAGEPKTAILRCSGRACDTFGIEVVLGDRKPVRALLFATRFALPPHSQPLVAARPANSHPQYGPDSSIRMRAVRF